MLQEQYNDLSATLSCCWCCNFKCYYSYYYARCSSSSRLLLKQLLTIWESI